MLATPVKPQATPPANTVSLGELQNPVAVQEAPPITEEFTSFVASRAPDLSGEQAAVDTSRSTIRDLNTQISTRGERGAELDQQYGLNQLDARNAELSEDIAERTAAFNNAIVNEEGAVRPIEFITGRQSHIRRQKAVELEGLAAVQAAVQGNIALAESRIEKTLEREFGALEDQLEAEKFELTENKEALTDKDAKATAQLERELAERGRVLAEQKETKKEILSLATEAAANGAPNRLTAQIAKATDSAEALRLAGSYIGKLEREGKQASNAASWALANQRLQSGQTFTTRDGGSVEVPSFQEWADENGGREWHVGGSKEEIEALRQRYDDEMSVMEQAAKVSALSPLAREVVNNPQAYYDFTATQKGEIFEELSSVGIDTNDVIAGKKKTLPATQVESLSQARNVKDDVEKLYDMLQNLPGNGPIGGRLQALDPYNEKRVAIDAQITRIVPGLARGIFNEVGVLTNEDVDRYTRTIANPNMTDAQIERLHQDTLYKIDQSIDSTVDTFDLAGYNVDSFISTNSAEDGMTDDEAYEAYLAAQKN